RGSREHPRTVRVQINAVLKRETGSRKFRVGRRQAIETVGVAITDQPAGVIESDASVENRGEAFVVIIIDVEDVKICRGPQVGIQIRQKGGEVDFPWANTLIAQVTIRGR